MKTNPPDPRQLEKMIGSCEIRPPMEVGDPLEEAPMIRLAAGSAADLINEDREEK